MVSTTEMTSVGGDIISYERLWVYSRGSVHYGCRYWPGNMMEAEVFWQTNASVLMRTKDVIAYSKPITMNQPL